MDIGDVTFIHISDSHIGPTADFARHGLAALPCAERMVELINALDPAPDFVVHTGDVVTEPAAASYAHAQSVFARLTVPLYCAVGNHDTAADLRRCMPIGPHTPLLPDDQAWSYAFDLRGHRFLAIDARGPDEIDPHGRISPAQWAVIDRELTSDGPPLTVFTHFPLLRVGSPWIDRTMLVVDGETLHRRLAAVAHRVRGVFLGHIHQALHSVVDGIFYSAAPSTFAQLTGGPTDEVAGEDRTAPPGYAVVRVTPSGVVVRTLSFPRP
ncbi:MAG: metallophosphoesterase [Ardenticatenales bacterium]